MPERTDYAPGTPSWVDIGTDVAGAKKFYGGLFGWETAEAGPAEETGGYGFFLLRGKMVAGFGPQMNPGPPVWSTYFSVDDAEQTAKAVEAAGGTTVMAPMDVMTAGRMAVFQDPAGAFFSIWQPGEHKGAQIVNETGSLCWNELNSRDIEKAKPFYAEVFGWGLDTHAGEMEYTEFKVADTTVGGMMTVPPQVPAEVPSHWLVYFMVDDVDASTAKAEKLGATILMPGMDIPGTGRFSVISDPQGAALALFKAAEA